MDRKLIVAFAILFIFLLSFIFIMIRSEYKNMEELRVQYPDLNEDVYSLRKDSLNVWAVRLLISFIIPTWFLMSGLSQRLSYKLGDGKNLLVSGFLYGAIFLGIIFLINLPINFYSGFILRHKYGLTNQSVLRWIELSIKGFLVNDLVIALFLWIPYYFIYSSPKNWWIKMGIIAIPIIIFMVFISPFIIDPIFNKYTSIENEALGEKIEELLDRGGIPEAGIYKVDKSRDTKTMNAYMTGIFGSKRIVLWDTTIDNLTESEILNITAHEMGHYLKGHIWKNIIFGIVGTFIILFLMYISSNWILKASKGVFGFKNLYNYASVPILLLTLNLFSFFGNPIQNYVSRSMEIEADRYEISLTQDRTSAVTAMEKLHDTSLGIPRPSKIYKLWYHTHPPLEERIEFYKTEEFEYIP